MFRLNLPAKNLTMFIIDNDVVQTKTRKFITNIF